jgi:hypothetical protein
VRTTNGRKGTARSNSRVCAFIPDDYRSTGPPAQCARKMYGAAGDWPATPLFPPEHQIRPAGRGFVRIFAQNFWRNRSWLRIYELPLRRPVVIRAPKKYGAAGDCRRPRCSPQNIE